MTSPVDVTINVTSAATTEPPPKDGSIRGLNKPGEDYVIILESLVFFFLWFLAMIGNMLVVIVILRSRRVQSTTNFFVASIAVSDIVLVLFSAPFVCVRVMMQEWVLGHLMCRLVRFIQFSSMSSTSFVLVAISVDRYYTILYPLSFKVTRGTAKRMIITGSIIACLISSLCIYFFDHVEVNDPVSVGDTRFVCPTYIPASHWPGVLYALLCVVSQYLCPLVIVTSVYFRIFSYIRSIRRRVRRCSRSNNPVPRTKVKMVKMLMLLSFVTLLLYLPYYLTLIVYCLSYTRFLSADVFISTFWLIAVSTAVKPIIYACGNSNFWRGCKEVLCMSTMRCYRINNYTVTNASSISKRNYVGVLDLSKDQVSITIDSPLDAFNKNRYNEKATWPINGSLPSTSL